MSTPQPVAPPAAAPWYRTAVFRGILVAFFTGVIARVAAKFHINIAALNAIGINPDELAQMAMDGIATMALAYALHGRATKPLPAVTLTQKKADAVNAAAAQTVNSLQTGDSNAKDPTAPAPPAAG
jgi:hypothetical protein